MNSLTSLLLVTMSAKFAGQLCTIYIYRNVSTVLTVTRSHIWSNLALPEFVLWKKERKKKKKRKKRKKKRKEKAYSFIFQSAFNFHSTVDFY